MGRINNGTQVHEFAKRESVFQGSVRGQGPSVRDLEENLCQEEDWTILPALCGQKASA